MQNCWSGVLDDFEDSKKRINMLHKTFATLLFVTGQVLASMASGRHQLLCCRVSTDVATPDISRQRAPSIVTSSQSTCKDNVKTGPQKFCTHTLHCSLL